MSRMAVRRARVRSVGARWCFASGVVLLAACGRRDPLVIEAGTVVAPASVDAAVEDVETVDPSDLAPGDVRVFGLLLPLGTQQHLEEPGMKMFYVSAPMNRVMRYLQRRLEVTNGDIRPLGAFIRRARVRFTPPGQALFVDVGLRDEGDRTFLTVWNRPALPIAMPLTTAESLVRAGFDPDSGRPLIGNHH